MPKVNKSEQEWRDQLTPEQYHVTREKGTERPFTGEYWDHFEHGSYDCICCGTPLFDGTTKFASSCGWPSFYAPKAGQAIDEAEDRSYGWRRTEVLCPSCGAHLGHVFPDGPPPTGTRYCINSAALSFRPADAEKG